MQLFFITLSFKKEFVKIQGGDEASLTRSEKNQSNVILPNDEEDGDGSESLVQNVNTAYITDKTKKAVEVSTNKLNSKDWSTCMSQPIR